MVMAVTMGMAWVMGCWGDWCIFALLRFPIPAFPLLYRISW
jgi:hypothetical protein